MNKPLKSNALLSNTEAAIPLSAANCEEPLLRPIPPIPLGGTVGRTSVFPVDALGAFGSEAAKNLHDYIQAPMALCAQAVICAMSTTVSSWGHVKAIYGSSLPISVYLITVAQSGERKTAVDSLAQLGIKAYEREVLQLAKSAEVEDSLVGEDLPESDILVNDPTYEGLLGIMSRGQGFACLSNDDAAGFLGGNSMNKENRQKTIAGLSQIWSGSDVKRPRAHGRDTCISNVPLTMSLMFQPYLIGQVYGDREMVEQGILPRVLPCYPESTMGKRLFAEVKPEKEEKVRAFATRVFDTLQELRTLRACCTTPSDRFSSGVPTLPLSTEARVVLIDFYNEIEVQLGIGGKFEAIRGFAGRATENATRLAAIITLFDDIQSTEVSEIAALSACNLMRFYLDEFAFLLRLGKSERDNSSAGDLGKWMARRYGAGGTGYDKDVSQFAPAAFRKKGDRQLAIQTLVDHHWIELLPAGTFVDGAKRKEAFRVSPLIANVL
ncbi:DUF3987 domain-containing protein [Ruegeria sp. HKCCC2117]|uniref:DUF3987 domain-containing protein n=1 Tax=Ruegeria sp. HKCCC2117 TaxID=2682992 RepID=UPI001488AA1B|nr:DUF3987 domain-containing protein [Ruegeria sp. HKCCC2117]